MGLVLAQECCKYSEKYVYNNSRARYNDTRAGARTGVSISALDPILNLAGFNWLREAGTGSLGG